MAKAALKQSVEETSAPTIAMSMKDKLEQQRIEESRLVKGVFQDNEKAGGTIRFPFKKYPGEEIKDYILTDGQEYELPLSVVRHLNNGCAYTEDAYVEYGLLGADGKPLKNASAKKKHRFAFKVSEYN